MTVIEGVPVDDRGSVGVREPWLGRAVVALLALVLYYGLGWAPAKLVMGLVWCRDAVRSGWLDARGVPVAGGGDE